MSRQPATTRGARGTTSPVAAAERALERLFRLTSNRRLQAAQTAIVGHDVTRAGYAVLRHLDEHGEANLGEIARACAMDPAAAGRQVRLLLAEGLVVREISADDARVALVGLTPAGGRAYRRIESFRARYLERVLAGWSAHDRADLVRLVDRLVDDLRHSPVPAAKGSPTS